MQKLVALLFITPGDKTRFHHINNELIEVTFSHSFSIRWFTFFLCINALKKNKFAWLLFQVLAFRDEETQRYQLLSSYVQRLHLKVTQQALNQKMLAGFRLLQNMQPCNQSWFACLLKQIFNSLMQECSIKHAEFSERYAIVEFVILDERELFMYINKFSDLIDHLYQLMRAQSRNYAESNKRIIISVLYLHSCNV